MSSEKDSPVVLFLRRFWPGIFLFLLPLIPLYRVVLFGESIGPFDQIRQMSPWNGPKTSQPWDVLQADGVLQFYVWRDLVFSSWGKGQIPFWNPYQLAGTPLLANSQSGALYPPHVILGLLHVPTGAAMTLLAWLHLFWAGLGCYILCRSLGGKRLGGVVAGASFSLSTFMIAWTGLPSVIETVSWIPWVLGLLVMLFRPGSSPERLRITLAFGASVGLMVLAGHLQFVAYGFLALTVLGIWLLVASDSSSGETKERVKSALSALLGLVFGLAIAAPQLLPVLSYSQFSHRKNSPSEQGYQAYVGSAIQPYELVKMVVPTIQGNPRQLASGDFPISTYYPAVLKPGANFAESAIGIGAFGLVLVCLLPLVATRKEQVWGVVAISVVALLLATGTPLNKLLYFVIPGWSSTGSPGRVICLFVLGVAVACGFSVSRLENVTEILKSDFKKLLPSAIGFLGICVLCFAVKNSFELRPGLNPEIIEGLKSQAESTSLSSGIGIILISILSVAFAIHEKSLRSRVVLLLIPVLSSIAFFGTTLIQTGQSDLAVKNDAKYERIAPINGAWDLLLAPRATVPPNLSALNRIHSLDGYDSLLHRDTVGLLQDIDGKNPAPDANGNMMFIKPTADWKKLAEAGVTQVWSASPITQLDEVAPENGLYKYKLLGPGRVSTPEGPGEIISESASQILIKANGPGKLTVRDRNMPGWVAKVDGGHATLGNGTWMELDLTPGEHLIVLNYVAPGFMNGIFLLLLALVSAACVTLAISLRERSRTKQVRGN